MLFRMPLVSASGWDVLQARSRSRMAVSASSTCGWDVLQARSRFRMAVSASSTSGWARLADPPALVDDHLGNTGSLREATRR